MESRLLRIPPRPRRALGTFGAAVLLGGALMGIGGDESAVGLAFAAVRQGNISATVGAAGSVRSGRIREIGFAAAGTVTKVNVHSGQEVKAGDVLAELDNTQAAEAVTAAVAALAAANEAAANVGNSSTSPAASGGGQRTPSKSPSARPSKKPTPTPTPAPSSPGPSPTGSGSKPPKPSRSPSRSPSPSASASAATSSGGTGRTSAPAKSGSGGSGAGGGSPAMTQQQADANVLKAQVALDQARRTLAGTQIVAPTAGTILSVAGPVGTVVNGPGSSGFVTIGNLDELQVEADFSESAVAKLKIGQAATVTLTAGNGGPFDGTVAHIEPAATTSGSLVQYGVMIAFDRPPGHLLIGQTATVQVTTDQAQDALYVPSRALRPTPSGGYTVLVKHGDATTTRQVQVGIRGDQYAQIRSGLTPGDQVELT